MEKSSAYKFALAIITDKRNENRYCTTQIRNIKTGEVKATYTDVVKVLEEAYYNELEQEKRDASSVEI